MMFIYDAYIVYELLYLWVWIWCLVLPLMIIYVALIVYDAYGLVGLIVMPKLSDSCLCDA